MHRNDGKEAAEVLTPARSAPTRGCAKIAFRSHPATVPGQVLQPLMAPSMSGRLRDELECNLADFAAAIDRHVAV